MSKVVVEYSNRLQQAVDSALSTTALSVAQNNRTRGRSALNDISDSASGYTGFFKVIDASETKDDGTKTLKIKVVDGADASASLCGFALVNGYIREVSTTTIEISDKSTRTAYLYLNAVEETESDGVTPKTPVFELVNQKIMNGTQIQRALIATIRIYGNTLTIVQQNYGVPYVFIWGTCQ